MYEEKTLLSDAGAVTGQMKIRALGPIAYECAGELKEGQILVAADGARYRAHHVKFNDNIYDPYSFCELIREEASAGDADLAIPPEPATASEIDAPARETDNGAPVASENASEPAPEADAPAPRRRKGKPQEDTDAPQ